jgi:hypothetical protein
MHTSADLYEDSALLYISLIRQESAEAAAAIELIQTNYGSHAALRAALIITILKMEIQQNHWMPNISLYVHLLEAYPEALPMTKYAMLCCLQKWELPVVETAEWRSLSVT